MGLALNGSGSGSRSRSGPRRPRSAPTPEAVNLLMDPQFQELLARLLLSCRLILEARQAVAAVLLNEEPPTRLVEQILAGLRGRGSNFSGISRRWRSILESSP